MSIISNHSATLSSGTSLTVSAFTTSGSSRRILLYIGYAGPANGTSTKWQAPTRDGQTFTILDDGGSFPAPTGEASDHYVEAWVLYNPNTTSASISLSTIGAVTAQGVVAWAVVEDNVAQSGAAVTRVTLDREIAGDPTTITGAANLTASGTAVAFAWASNQAGSAFGTPSWTDGTELLATQSPQTWARSSGAYKTGSGALSFTFDTALSSGAINGVCRLLVVEDEPPFSAASLGAWGTGNSSASSTTLTFTTNAAINAGETGFLLIASDNTSTTDADNNEVTGVSGGTGTWTELGEYTNGNGAANAGVTTAVWRFAASGTLASGSSITITFTSARGDKCATGWRFSSTYPLILDPDQGTNPINNVTDASNGFGSAAFSGLSSRGHLVVRGLGKEANSTTALTVSADFAAFTNTRSRNNVAAISLWGEWDIVPETATSVTSNPTLAVSGDTSAVYVALIENVPKFLFPARLDGTPSFYAATVGGGGAGSQALTPTRLDNTNSFYAATIGVGAVNLSAARHDNSQTFYAPTVGRGAVGLIASRLDGGQTFYSATVTAGAVNLSANRLDGAATFYSATVTTGPVALTPSRLDGVQTFYAASIAAVLSASRVDNSQTFYAPTVSAGSVGLLPTRVDGIASFYAATITTGVVNLSPSRHNNAETFYAATVGRGAVGLIASRLEGASTFYTPTVAPGPAALTASRVDGAQSFYAATVSVGAVGLSPTRLDGVNAFYQATITTGALNLAAARFDNANTFYGHVITTGSVSLVATRHDNINAFYAATVAAGSSILTAPRLDNTNGFYSHALTVGAVSIFPTRLDNTQNFYSATISTGEFNLIAARHDNVQTFFGHTVAPGSVDILPTLFSNAQAWYVPTVGVGAVDLLPTKLDNNQTWFTQNVSTLTELVVARFNNDSSFYSFVVSNGSGVYPPPYQVLLGVNYGPTGVEYTGTLEVFDKTLKYNISEGTFVKPLTNKVVMSL